MILYVDESGDPSAEVFGLGGVAIAEDRYHELRSRWIEIASDNGRDPKVEIKWSRVKGNGQLALRLADALVQCEVTAFAVLLRPRDGRKLTPELFGGEDTYATALMFLAERFQRHLAARGERGMIVIDHRNPKQDERLRRFFGRLVERGTPFSTLDRIIDPILLAPSDDTIGIQAADLVIGPLLALSRTDAAARRSPRIELARALHERMLPCFARHPDTNELDGVGIKRYPDASRTPPMKLFDLRGGGSPLPARSETDPPAVKA